MKYIKILRRKGKKKYFYPVILWDTDLHRSIGIFGKFSNRQDARKGAMKAARELGVEVK